MEKRYRDIGDTPDTNHSAAGRQRRLAPSAQHRLAEHLAQRADHLPVWVRAPVRGCEFYSGLTRAKLYQLATERRIRSVSLREPGAARGCRLFHLRSIFAYIEGAEKLAADDQPVAGNGGSL